MQDYIIVESPGKIDNIQKYAGNQAVVVACRGHINELSKGGRYGIGVNPLNHFQTHYTLLPDKIEFLDTIISNVDNIKRIIIATDFDIEGHGIAYHIAQNLKHLNKPICRCIFSEITQEGIEYGLQHLSELDYNKFRSQETRRIADRLIGFMASPYLINYYGPNLSAGRVQSVAARMIVEREREIKSFKPQEYWNIHLKLGNDQQTYNAKLSKKVATQTVADQIKHDISQPTLADSIFVVTSVSKKPKREAAPPPLNTAKLQQIMASKFGLEGEQTMAAAQRLYEMGHITYMRTDSVRIADSALTHVRAWLSASSFADKLSHKPNIFRNKEASQDAHECIRPTDVSHLPDQIDIGEYSHEVYQMIWNYFVSCQMVPAIYDTIDARIEHTTSKHVFKLAGKLLSDPGYLTVLENRCKSNAQLPILNKDDVLQLVDDNSIVLEQKFTQPPSRYNYASLLEKMETNGIGRPATYADIIGKITHRHYVDKQGNSFYATELGDKITTILSQYFEFMEYGYTADLERQMDLVAEGKANYLDVLSTFYKGFVAKLNEAHMLHGGRICDRCKTPMYLRKGKSGEEFYSCSLWNFCKNVSKAA